jgi:hypothetical protein
MTLKLRVLDASGAEIGRSNSADHAERMMSILGAGATVRCAPKGDDGWLVWEEAGQTGHEPIHPGDHLFVLYIRECRAARKAA